VVTVVVLLLDEAGPGLGDGVSCWQPVKMVEQATKSAEPARNWVCMLEAMNEWGKTTF
jgi:hypothetical protein